MTVYPVIASIQNFLTNSPAARLVLEQDILGCLETGCRKAALSVLDTAWTL